MPFDEKLFYRQTVSSRINWISVHKKKPFDGEEVWILFSDPMGHYPTSFKIVAGEVQYISKNQWVVNTFEFFGHPSLIYYPKESKDDADYDKFQFWCDKYEIYIPEVLIDWNGNSGVP